jgi:hypothetical protein
MYLGEHLLVVDARASFTWALAVVIKLAPPGDDSFYVRVFHTGHLESPKDGATVKDYNARGLLSEEGKSWKRITEESSGSCLLR